MSANKYTARPPSPWERMSMDEVRHLCAQAHIRQPSVDDPLVRTAFAMRASALLKKRAKHKIAEIDVKRRAAGEDIQDY